MIFFQKCRDRDELGVLLGPAASRLLHPVDIEPGSIQKISGHEIVLAWSYSPLNAARIPEMILTADGMVEETSAWISTYAPTLKPYSSQFHLCELSRFVVESSNWAIPQVPSVSHALAGLVLGEVISISGLIGDDLLDRISVKTCQATLSWALLRDSLVRRLPTVDIIDRWRHARMLTGQRESRIPLNHIELAARLLDYVQSRQDDAGVLADEELAILRGLEQICLRGEIASRSQVPSKFASVLSTIRGPREARLLVVERLVRDARTYATALSIVDEFAVAYAVSLISPGSFAHVGMLRELTEISPSVLLWFGMCVGLHPESRVGYELNGFGVRMVRDLTIHEEFVARPTADISLLELDMYLGKEPYEADFPTGNLGSLSVELIRGVVTTIPWSPRSRALRAERGSSTLGAPTDSGPWWVERELNVRRDQVELLGQNERRRDDLSEVGRGGAWDELGSNLRRALDLYGALRFSRAPQPQLGFDLGKPSTKGAKKQRR